MEVSGEGRQEGEGRKGEGERREERGRGRSGRKGRREKEKGEVILVVSGANNFRESIWSKIVRKGLCACVFFVVFCAAV